VPNTQTRKLPATPDAVAPGVRDPKNPRRRRPPARAPGRLGRWGSLQGGLGICLIVAGTAIGAIATMATGSAPGFLLGVFVIIGTIAAALAVRPTAGRIILPAPVLCYLVAALITGVIYNRSDDSSKTALAIGAAQWIADGFIAMAIATVAAIALIGVRWFRWRRHRPAPTTRRPPGDWSEPAARGPYNFSNGA
jgi:hypothetical protein